jgi:hypothetical protein
MFQSADLVRVFERNADCKSMEFQTQLTNYQKLTGEIIRGSYYEIDIYKKKLKQMEKHCQELEKKVEFVFLNQKFYEEIVDDFIYFKKLADVCADVGGYYDPYAPTERYDQRFNKKLAIEQNGVLDLKRLNEEMKSDESNKVKKLQTELDILKNKYFSLKQDFELMTLNNNELKTNIYNLKERSKSSNENYEQEKLIQELKEENKELSIKINKLLERIDNIQQGKKDGKINEDIISVSSNEIFIECKMY